MGRKLKGFRGDFLEFALEKKLVNPFELSIEKIQVQDQLKVLNYLMKENFTLSIEEKKHYSRCLTNAITKTQYTGYDDNLPPLSNLGYFYSSTQVLCAKIYQLFYFQEYPQLVIARKRQKASQIIIAQYINQYNQIMDKICTSGNNTAIKLMQKTFLDLYRDESQTSLLDIMNIFSKCSSLSTALGYAALTNNLLLSKQIYKQIISFKPAHPTFKALMLYKGTPTEYLTKGLKKAIYLINALIEEQKKLEKDSLQRHRIGQ